MINEIDVWWIGKRCQRIHSSHCFETGQKRALEIFTLDKRVRAVAVRGNSSHNHRTVLVFQLFRFADGFGATFHRNLCANLEISRKKKI